MYGDRQTAASTSFLQYIFSSPHTKHRSTRVYLMFNSTYLIFDKESDPPKSTKNRCNPHFPHRSFRKRFLSTQSISCFVVRTHASYLTHAPTPIHSAKTFTWTLGKLYFTQETRALPSNNMTTGSFQSDFPPRTNYIVSHVHSQTLTKCTNSFLAAPTFS